MTSMQPLYFTLTLVFKFNGSQLQTSCMAKFATFFTLHPMWTTTAHACTRWGCSSNISLSRWGFCGFWFVLWHVVLSFFSVLCFLWLWYTMQVIVHVCTYWDRSCNVDFRNHVWHILKWGFDWIMQGSALEHLHSLQDILPKDLDLHVHVHVLWRSFIFALLMTVWYALNMDVLDRHMLCPKPKAWYFSRQNDCMP